ncbi:collagen alpha-1(XII) chain-like [Dermacentor andersoni]|uniref:collagen alpha-1(XII) chain-like n=1 Tax=Dermacentor andersoni TaxID=34620 RepID=UPI0024173C88|nr:uncharacterized protein LOC126544566 [Dermacentor andersoni]
MKRPATLFLLLWVNFEANSGTAASVVHLRNGAHSRMYRREVYDSSSRVLQISGLEATVHGGNRATVKWDNATGPVTGYNMTVCLVTDSSRCESMITEKTSHNLHHLASGRTYQVNVHAYVEVAGDTTNGRSERIFFTTTKLPTVEHLEATQMGPTSVELKWVPSQDAASHFDIDACPSDGGACVHGYTPNVTHILEDLTPDTNYEIKVRSATEEEKELSFGPASTVSATTSGLPAVSDVVVRATCDSFIVTSWNYSVEGITGFLLNLCAEGRNCMTRSVDKDDREHTFRVDAVLRSYTLSIEAYLWRGNAKRSSPVVNQSVTSFPEVPRLDRLEVEAISPSQIRARWTNGFDVDVRIQVCVAQTAKRNCVNYAAHGTQLGYTVSGLSPSTKYSVEATAVVSLGVDTCLGLASTREVTTLTEAVCRYDDEMKQTIGEISNNVRALVRRRNRVDAKRKDDAIGAKCEIIEAKLRTLPEKDVNDCLDDIDNLIETYKRKTADLISQ